MTLRKGAGALAGDSGSAWMSPVRSFQTSKPERRGNRGGAPAKAHSVRISPEKPHLAQ